MLTMAPFDGSSPPAQPLDDLEFHEAPTWPKVIGIIAIVFGVLYTLCCGGMGLLGSLFSQPMVDMMAKSQPQFTDNAVPPMMTPHPLQVSAAILTLIAGIILFAGGIMLCARSALARATMIAFGLFAVLAVVLSVVRSFGAVDEMDQWVKDHPNSLFSQNYSSAATRFNLLWGPAVSLVFPVFILVWFLFVKTRHSDMLGSATEQ
jgi:uncharacterized membrane protein HdeD (DUF308 family)